MFNKNIKFQIKSSFKQHTASIKYVSRTPSQKKDAGGRVIKTKCKIKTKKPDTLNKKGMMQHPRRQDKCPSQFTLVVELKKCLYWP